jgi:ATP-dependent Clp protease ATP-binding subunit ClpA
MFERFTAAARAAVVHAQELAREQGSATIGAEHLLVGVLSDDQGVPAAVLRRWDVDAARVTAAVSGGAAGLDDQALAALGIDLDEVRRRTEDAFGPGALDQPVRTRRKGHVPFTTEAKAALGESVRSAVLGSAREIGSAQLFLGLLAMEEGTAVRTLRRVGVDASTADLRRLVQAEIGQAA